MANTTTTVQLYFLKKREEKRKGICVCVMRGSASAKFEVDEMCLHSGRTREKWEVGELTL
jgi:hypothetical protein